MTRFRILPKAGRMIDLLKSSILSMPAHDPMADILNLGEARVQVRVFGHVL